jgi:competence protein ComGC
MSMNDKFRMPNMMKWNIEIMVVVAIIAILTALIVPACMTADKIQEERTLTKEKAREMTPAEYEEYTLFKYYKHNHKYCCYPQKMNIKEWRILKKNNALCKKQ